MGIVLNFLTMGYDLDQWLKGYGHLIDALAVFGTLVAAVITAWLAWQTRATVRASLRMADASDEQLQISHQEVDLTRQALNASVQPLLVDAPQGLKRDESGRGNHENHTIIAKFTEEKVTVEVSFVNIGAGVALVTGAGINYTPDVGWSADSIGKTILKVDEYCRLTFVIPRDRPELSELIDHIGRDTFTVAIYYTNLFGTNPVTSKANIWKLDQRRGDMNYRVRQLHLYRPGEQEPFAGSGPAND